MNVILFFICIPILFIYPILYPPIACFTAIFFIQDKKISHIALFLVFSSVIITSLISATIIPVADTERYIESFQEIDLFDFTELALENNGFEPLYKVYEYILSIFIDDNQNLFLLITAIIFNTLSTIAILRICLRLNQPKLSCIILVAHYSLFVPALGMPLFLLRSSLSLSILLLAISFYQQRQLIFYLLGIVSILIHFSSLLIFAIVILHNCFYNCGDIIKKTDKKIFFISLNKTFRLRVYLMIFVIVFVLVIASPSLITEILQSNLLGFLKSGNLASSKAKSFLDASNENFVDLTNPVFLIQILLSLLCFLKVQDVILIEANTDNINNQKLSVLLESLRLIGRLLMITIIITSPFNVLPYRIGFFNFLYFPLWLINVPFLSLQEVVKKYSKYLILFPLICVLVYTFYWMPKREANKYYIVILEGKPLKYNLVQTVEHLLNN
jgi:EpsG family